MVEINNDALLPLEPVLKQWIKFVIRYSETESKTKAKDACYWYNERANVGILAAAAWKAGWAALEEYPTQKRKGAGRCDLYIKNEQLSFALEAKRVWQNIASQNPYDKVNENFGSAWKDAGQLLKDEAGTRLAACFVVPFLHETKNKTKKEFFEWRDRLVDNIKPKPDALAWVFPKVCALLSNVDGYIHPGVYLLLKVRQRNG